MSDIKMKPCPFCGSAPVQSSSNNGEGFMDAWIECENNRCDINPSVSDPNLYTAIEMWNKRNNDTLVAQNLALKAALETLIGRAEECDSWESFPCGYLDDAYKALEVGNE